MRLIKIFGILAITLLLCFFLYFLTSYIESNENQTIEKRIEKIKEINGKIDDCSDLDSACDIFNKLHHG